MTHAPTSPTLQSPVDGFPSTFAQAGRVRRSTDQGRVSQLPTIASSGASPATAPRSTSLTVQSGEGSGDKPVPLSLTLRAASFSSTGNAGGAESSLNPPAANVRSSTLSPTARTASPAITTSSRSSLASPPPPISSSTPPIARPASASPADYATYAAGANADANPLNSQHLSVLNVQQNQAEMQEQYMRTYMAMMANPMLAQQAHYQMMLQRHQQQYYGRAASAMGFAGGSHMGAGANGNGVQPVSTQGAGGPPLAAFMQPAQAMAMQSTDAIAGSGERGRVKSLHKRTQSSGSLYDNGAANGANAASSTSQPMLSMMMAPPPSSSGTNAAAPAASSPTFGPQAFYGSAHPQALYPQPTVFYPNGAHGFPPMMGGGSSIGWGQQPAVGGHGGRPGYVPSRSELGGVSSALRSQRSSEKGLRQQQH